MQKKILIIGNGFDLYHKLPTGYRDFLFFVKHWKDFKEQYDNQRNSDTEESGPICVRFGMNNELIKETLQDFANHPSLYFSEHINYLDEHIRIMHGLHILMKLSCRVKTGLISREKLNVL